MKNNKNVELFSKNLINITSNITQNIIKAKKYYLVLEVTVLSLENCFQFFVLIYSYFIVGTEIINLCKAFCLT